MLRNLSWLGASSALAKPVWFLFITAYVIGVLGPAAYGRFTAAMVLGGIVVGLCVAGTAAVTVRDVARQRSLATAYWANLMPVRAILALLALLLLEGIGRLLDQPPVLLRAAWVYWFVQTLLDFLRAFFRAAEQMRYEAETVVLEKLASVVGGGVALSIAPSPTALLLGMAAGTALTAAFAAWRVHQRVTPLRMARLDPTLIGRAFGAALPLGLSAVFIAIYVRIDVVMVERMIGATEAGLYSVAYRFIEALSQLPELLMIVLLPRLAILYGQGAEQRSARLLRTSVVVLLGAGIAIAGLLAAGAPWILHLLMPEAAAAVSLLRIVIWVFPLAAVNYAFSTALIARDDQQALMWMLGLAALVNVSLNLLLIPRYAGAGAAVATLATEALLLLLLALRYKRRLLSSPTALATAA